MFLSLFSPSAGRPSRQGCCPSIQLLQVLLLSRSVQRSVGEEEHIQFSFWQCSQRKGTLKGTVRISELSQFPCTWGINLTSRDCSIVRRRNSVLEHPVSRNWRSKIMQVKLGTLGQVSVSTCPMVSDVENLKPFHTNIWFSALQIMQSGPLKPLIEEWRTLIMATVQCSG